MYPQETRTTILEQIAEGKSLREVCRQDGMPGFRTVMEWLDAEEDFRTKYARAREAQADVLFDGMATIEDKVEAGELKPDAARVILDSRRWRAEKLKPKVYGSKADVNITGSLSITSIKRTIVDPAKADD